MQIHVVGQQLIITPDKENKEGVELITDG